MVVLRIPLRTLRSMKNTRKISALRPDTEQVQPTKIGHIAA